MHDAPVSGVRLRGATVADIFTRECRRALEDRRSHWGEEVRDVARMAGKVGGPRRASAGSRSA